MRCGGPISGTRGHMFFVAARPFLHGILHVRLKVAEPLTAVGLAVHKQAPEEQVASMVAANDVADFDSLQMVVFLNILGVCHTRFKFQNHTKTTDILWHPLFKK
jgi:hypothetical protein